MKQATGSRATLRIRQNQAHEARREYGPRQKNHLGVYTPVLVRINIAILECVLLVVLSTAR
jgi:hypothetical protein